MQLSITHQESYSRGELLLRTFFGWIYIAVPHLFLLFFIAIWASIIQFISFWAILFTGKFPKGFFDTLVGFYRWYLRLEASLSNLVDGYPQFGLSVPSDGKVTFEAEYPVKLSRGVLILKCLFGLIYVIIPHYFLLFFLSIWASILMLAAWWVVLFTGKYPESWHEFQVRLLRWEMRVNLYLSFMTDKYPPFNGNV